MSRSPLRPFVWSAALWLPACFTLWALSSSLLVFLVVSAMNWLLPALFPYAVTAVEQHGVVFEVVTTLQTETLADGRVGVLVLTGTPLIYAWCLALYAGLVMATPLERRQWLKQLAIGLAILSLVVLWGACFNVLKQLTFDAGPLGAAVIERAGLKPDLIALGYQFGYLILPPVAPIVLWIGQNQAFLRYLVGWAGEPEAAVESQSRNEQAASASSSVTDQDSA
ncbi:exosortase H-associated membrane protein [Pseudomarimonas arenosa]|uniref:Uncharacterized protein n=1 Tax=Pseudomarimonas arenosa TaxID=2774145 RepID=A0AAW3ZKC1_9GAMM|nr:exosortase H-associated membrane protein [Pseudomarimonas arenosa]MBD8526456.1 hypothetical protein [Pseudomarimonas arenosa]